MDASRKPSIATEVHASHERPHRLALLATSPVATGEAIMPLYPKASPARAGERSTSANHTSLTLVFLGRFPIRPVTQSAAPKGLLLGQVSRGTA